MIQEALSIARGSRIDCDLCIVGAGAAGITLAAELAGRGLEVVLLESGGREREPETQDLYAGETRGAPQYPTRLSRLRFLGGTTNHWLGMCRPFDALDFEARDWVPGSGWPIGLAELEPFYRRAHAVCDLGPFEYSSEAWQGFGAPGPVLAREREVEVKIAQHSPPTRFAEKYRALLESAEGPRVILHANAYEFVAHQSGEAVERIEVRTLDGHRFSVKARRYVLAAGGIENARLLLLSQSASPQGLGNDRGLVGRYFMDHPGALPFAALAHFDPAYHHLAKERVVEGIRLIAGIGLSAAAQREQRLLSNAVYMRRPMSIEGVRDFSFFNIVQAVEQTLDARDMEVVGFLDALAGAPASQQATLCWIRSEQAPNPDSRVMLGDELDTLGQRRLVLDWRLSELNLRSFVESARLYARVLSRSGVGRVKLMPWLLEGRKQGASQAADWWRYVTPGWHHMGTTRMASDASRGVVDADCRVFGVENLHVAGSSVFPTSSYINPTLTLVALAIRLADHLAEQLG